MKTRVLHLVPLTLFVVPLLPAQTSRDPQAPVPVHRAPPKAGDQTLLTPPGGENQKVYGPRYTSLIDAEAARALSDRFRAAYGQQPTAPRIVIYVNRALIDDAGMRQTGRAEKVYETTTAKDGAASTTTEVSGENTYAAPDETAKPTLADQQTVREIERLFGRVFRNAGAQLADQKTAAAMAAEQPGARLGASQSVKEREALRQVADIAIEVLISSRDLTVRQVSGDATYSVPDIQATAIRLSDAAILGQAAASDVLGGGGAEAGHVARQFGVSDITEATAFGLMEDMMTGK